MQREEALAFALTLPHAVADKPFEEDFDTTVQEVASYIRGDIAAD